MPRTLSWLCLLASLPVHAVPMGPVANAVFALSGERLRSLPLKPTRAAA
jgi:hypothetical protein